VTTARESEAGETEQVWFFDLRGGDPRCLTSIETGVKGFDWGPDGDQLVVKATDPEATNTDGEYPRRTDRLQFKSMDGWKSQNTERLFIVDTESGEKRELPGTEATAPVTAAGGLAPCWSPDGDRISFLSNQTDNPEESKQVGVFTVTPDGESLRQISTGSVVASAPRWSPDGNHIVFRTEEPGNPYVPANLRLHTVSGVTETIVDRQQGPVQSVHWIDEERLAVTLGDHGKTVLAEVSVPDGSVTKLDSGSWIPHASRVHAAGGTFVSVLSRPSDPGELFGIDTGVTRRTSFNTDFADAVPSPQFRRLSVERGGETIDTQVALPPDYDPADRSPLPTVTELHGGPFTYDSPTFDFARTFWTTRGYALVRVNYRGSTSFGQEFAEAGRGTWNGPEVKDVLAAVDAVEQRGWADPDRQFLTGYSQGGIVTAYVLTRTDRFAAAAPERGIYDFRAVYGVNDEHEWYTTEFGTPWANAETYDRISAITDVGAIDTPTLVIACAFDGRCPPSQGEQLYTSLRRRSVDTELVVYDEPHYFTSPDNTVHRLETLEEWFRTHDSAR
jgi:dipeptidyl aminopeptidase/acylaminoacyl peptidase